VHPLFFGQYETFGREVMSLFAQRGVKLKFGREDFSEFLRRQTVGEADVAIGRWVGDYPDADTFVDGILHSQHGSIGRFVNNAEIDRLSDQARAEFDPTARHAIYRRIHEIIARDALLLPLFHEQVYRFARPEVEGLHLNLAVPEVALEELRVRR
jgi:ABC-type oligopeptide transport system substrate-binding subunit